MLLTSHFYSFIQHFDWQKIGEQIASTVFQLLLVSVGLLLVNWLGKKIIRHLFKQYKATKLVNGNTNRIDTIFTLILNIFFVHRTLLLDLCPLVIFGSSRWHVNRWRRYLQSGTWTRCTGLRLRHCDWGFYLDGRTNQRWRCC